MNYNLLGCDLYGRKIGTNLPEENIIEIGKPGFDWVRFSLVLGQKSFEEPVLSKCFPNIVLSEHPEITEIDSHRVIIDGGTFTYKFGNMANMNPKTKGIIPQVPFGVLDIRSSQGSNNNIKVLSVDEITARIEYALSVLQNTYGLCENVSFDSIKVKNAEISQTFPVTHSFAQYERVFNLVSIVLKKYFKGRKSSKEKIGSFRSLNENGKAELETAYVMKATSTTAKFYNKSKEKSDNDSSYVYDGDLCRFELTSSAQNIVNLAINGPRKEEPHSLYWCDVTQESLESFYHSYVFDIFNSIDEHLEKSVDFGKEKEVQFGLLQILDSSLSFVLRNTPDIYAESLLVNMAASEINNGIILFDLNDLIDKIEKSSLKEINKTLLAESLKTIELHPERYQPSCRNFIGQKELLDEIKTKMVCPKESYLFNVNSMDSEDNSSYFISTGREHPKYDVTELYLRNIYAPFDIISPNAAIFYEKVIEYEYSNSPIGRECRYPIAYSYHFFQKIWELDERIECLREPEVHKEDHLYYSKEEELQLMGDFPNWGTIYINQIDQFERDHPGVEYKRK